VARISGGARELVAGARDRAARGRGDLDPARQASAWPSPSCRAASRWPGPFDAGIALFPFLIAFVRASRPRADSVGCFEQRANAVLMLVVVGVFLPCVLAYTAWVPWLRARITLEEIRGRGPVLIGTDCQRCGTSAGFSVGTCARVRVLNAIWYESWRPAARAAPRETFIAAAVGATRRVPGRAP